MQRRTLPPAHQSMKGSVPSESHAQLNLDNQRMVTHSQIIAALRDLGPASGDCALVRRGEADPQAEADDAERISSSLAGWVLASTCEKACAMNPSSSMT